MLCGCSKDPGGCPTGNVHWAPTGHLEGEFAEGGDGGRSLVCSGVSLGCMLVCEVHAVYCACRSCFWKAPAHTVNGGYLHAVSPGDGRQLGGFPPLSPPPLCLCPFNQLQFRCPGGSSLRAGTTSFSLLFFVFFKIFLPWACMTSQKLW